MPLQISLGRGGGSRALLAALTLAGLTALAFAQANNPDYFRITGLKKEDNVNVRRSPEADAKIVGKIRKDTNGIKNLGCRGGLSQKQWDAMSDTQKKNTPRDRWCHVSHGDIKGWVLGRFLAEGTPPADAQAETPQAPSAPAQNEMKTQAPTAPAPVIPPMQTAAPTIDCAKAEKNAEKLVCGDKELGMLDREVGRLYAAASDALNATPGFEELLESQRHWMDQRNTCFDRDCLAEISALRIHQLRARYKETRKDDTRGISIGPVLVRCEGFPLPITGTFVNTEKGLVYLEWLGSSVVIPQVPSGSGIRYEGNFASMTAKGDDAVLRLPSGKMDMNCKLQKQGS